MIRVDKGKNNRGYFRAIYTVLWDDTDFRDLDSNTKLVFLYLRTSPDSNMPCIYRIYVEAIMKHTGLSEAIIRDSISVLCKTNWIEYEDNIVWVKKGLQFDPTISLNNIHHVKSIQMAIRSLPQKDIVQSFLSFYKITMEESGSAAPTKAAVKEDVERIMNLWNVICGKVLPKVIECTDRRRQLINVRLDERPDFKFWEELFKRVATTPFLLGDNNRGWKTTFDWVLNPNNLVKIMEGNWPTTQQGAAPKSQSQTTRGLWGNCKKCKKESLKESLNQDGLCSNCNPEAGKQTERLKELTQNIGKKIPSQPSTSLKPEPTA
jgi:hypothetical protein